MVCAAGNEGDSNGDTEELSYPAVYSECISVGAVDYSKNIARFTNSNKSVDLVAPGVSIMSTYPNNKYANLQGTSMATPVVSGAIALALQKNPGLRPEDIKLKLYESVEKNEKVRDGYTKAWGNLHVDNLLRLI